VSLVVTKGDIGVGRSTARTLLDGMPRLSVCMKQLSSLPSEGELDDPSWCYQMNSLNYYAEIFIEVTLPVLNLKLWLQATEYGKTK
jgi:hypothetical protein